jgi:hypothetical protein
MAAKDRIAVRNCEDGPAELSPALAFSAPADFGTQRDPWAHARAGRMKTLADFDLTTKTGRYQARKAGFHIPHLKGGPKQRSVWEMSDIKGPTDCWLWRGAVDRDGYGTRSDWGRTRHVHTIAWELSNGRSLPSGYVVRHSCDVRVCINPAHLLLGTQQENIADRQARDRAAKGERNGVSKLTADQVRAMRAEYVRGRNGGYARLARKYNVSPRAVFFIIKGQRWKHLEKTTTS